jgi:hypothetical protein
LVSRSGIQRGSSENVTVADDVFGVLAKTYVRHYGVNSVRRLSRLIADEIQMGQINTRQRLQNYIWMWYSGGSTAEAVSYEFVEKFPDYFRSDNGDSD